MSVSARVLNRVAGAVEALSEWTGRAAAWLVLVMVLLICYDVTMRYLFHSGSAAVQELEWHLFALVFLLGGAYTLKHDAHVRVDILYQSRWMNDRRRAWVDLMGGVVFMTPFCLLVIDTSWSFAYASYQLGEGSPDAGGLPYRFVLKGAIPVGFTLLLLQGLATIIRSLQVLLGQKPTGGG